MELTPKLFIYSWTTYLTHIVVLQHLSHASPSLHPSQDQRSYSREAGIKTYIHGTPHHANRISFIETATPTSSKQLQQLPSAPPPDLPPLSMCSYPVAPMPVSQFGLYRLEKNSTRSDQAKISREVVWVLPFFLNYPQMGQSPSSRPIPCRRFVVSPSMARANLSVSLWRKFHLTVPSVCMRQVFTPSISMVMAIFGQGPRMGTLLAWTRIRIGQ